MIGNLLYQVLGPQHEKDTAVCDGPRQNAQYPPAPTHRGDYVTDYLGTNVYTT